VGAHDAGQLEPPGVEVAGDDKGGSCGSRDTYGKAPDRPTAQNKDPASSHHSALEDGVHRVSGRVHDGADLGRNSVQLHHIRGGHRNELGKCPISIYSNDLGAPAEVGFTDSALETVSAHYVAFGRHQVAGLEQSG